MMFYEWYNIDKNLQNVEKYIGGQSGFFVDLGSKKWYSINVL